MPRIRIGGAVTDISLHGSVWDAADHLATLARTNLRSFVSGPWGPADEALAAEMVRRCASLPCGEQCFIDRVRDGEVKKSGCGCSSGWQYTSDEDVQTLEGCGPNDVWNDARGLLLNHAKVGRGDADPILCDCDDLAAACAAVAKFSAWKAQGSPTKKGRPVDRGEDISIGITRPKSKNMAHAYITTPWPPSNSEPKIKIDGAGFVFDPAGRWGMRRPPDSFYSDGEVAIYPVRFDHL